jgi:hypothetical protein|tara:strand:- start:964 stop:1149 length:186 start_codon:yes stop_codon:yes gene_type:complete
MDISKKILKCRKYRIEIALKIKRILKKTYKISFQENLLANTKVIITARLKYVLVVSEKTLK